MVLLVAKLVVECPKTGVEVDAKKVCVDCERFKHISWRGLTPYIMCGD